VPLAVAEVGPHEVLERFDAVHGGCHGPDCR
jgi:hypothetical protein